MAYCACQSGASYEQCCGPYHAGQAAPSAEALMRSRYCAFALGLPDYLLSTWHPDYRPKELELDAIQWRRLEILGVRAGGPGDTTGVVEFRAVWRDGTDRGELRERSSFVREGGRWYYTTGVVG